MPNIIRRAAVSSILSLAFAFGAAAATPAGGCAGIDYADEDASVLHLRTLYQEQRFAELEAVLACLLRDTRALSSGKPSNAVAYQLFRREMRAPGTTRDQLRRVEQWTQREPATLFAEFAALRLRYAFAWNVRGGGYAGQVAEDRYRAFHEGLAATEEALYRASPELRDTPMWHQLLLAVAGDTRTTRGDMAAVFERAVKRWPTNYDLHEVRLTRLVPRWGGNWEEVDAFIARFADQRKGEERDALYARLYAGVLIAGGDDPRATRLDWTRMKRGLDALAKLHPDPRHANIAVSFACRYRDVAYFESALQRLPPENVRPAAWLNGTDPRACIPAAKP